VQSVFFNQLLKSLAYSVVVQAGPRVRTARTRLASW